MFHNDPLCRRGRRAATLRDRSPSSRLKRKLRSYRLAHSGLCGGEARAGHPEGRAGDVVETRFVEEGDALRVAAVLPADPKLQMRVRPPPALDGHLDQL